MRNPGGLVEYLARRDKGSDQCQTKCGETEARVSDQCQHAVDHAMHRVPVTVPMHISSPCHHVACQIICGVMPPDAQRSPSYPNAQCHFIRTCPQS